MTSINESLFLWLNASGQPNPALLVFAKLCAEYVIWIVPLWLVAGWLRGSDNTRALLLEAAVCGAAGLLINQAISLVWQHPRPFVLGIGHTLIPHAPDSSFPSDHLTLMWAVAFSFMLHQRTRAGGVVLAVLGLPVAWSRIYLGVHFPIDMAGSAAVAGLSTWLGMRTRHWLVQPLLAPLTALHHLVFAPLIRRGWVR